MGTYKDIEDKRELSPAEQRRKESFEALARELEGQGYAHRDLTVGLVFANVMAIVLAAPLCAAFAVLFLWRWGVLLDFGPASIAVVIVAYVALIFAHEGIHGLTWGAFAKNHMASIEFGFIKEYMTPYCTILEPLCRRQYVLGALMPCIVLGIAPCVVAVAIGSSTLLLIGMLMVLGAGGDLTVVGKLLLARSSAKDVLYVDHPYQAGSVVFER